MNTARLHTPRLHWPHFKMRWRYVLIGFIVLLIAAAIAARLYLNIWLPQYVNQVLDSIPGYRGSISGIDIDLYRGAYKIHDLKIYKRKGNIPTPFVSIETTDLSIEWKALFHGRIVSNADLTKPIINFAVNNSGTVEQTGVEADWSKPIKDLMPIDIDVVTFRQGRLSYQDFSTNPKVNVYINNMSGEVRNLRNVEDKSIALPSTLQVRGSSIGKGHLAIDGRLNILRRIPDMDLNIKLEKVYLPALTDYSNAYASVDIREGTLNVYSEFTIKNNHVSGYVKPIATHVALIDLKKDSNPIKLFWQVVVATVVEIFTNHSKDQFATKVALEGSLDNIETSTWEAVSNIIRNAFVEALKRGFDKE